MRPLLSLVTWLVAATLPLVAQVDSVVVFNEIHYHPAGDDESKEFVELYNQNSVNVELSGWTLEGAGDFTFATGTIIEAQSLLVIAKNPGASELAGALGPLPGSLSNSGERLTLRNHNGRIMDRIEFGDSYPWPTGADGSGATLSKKHPRTSSGRPENWQASSTTMGTPGAANTTDPNLTLAFNEVPGVLEEELWVELVNHGASTIDLNGLTIITGDGQEASLPNVMLEPDQYLLLDSEALQFNVTDKLRLFLLSDRSFLDAVILQDHPRARRSDDFHGRYYVPDAPTPGIANTFSFQDQVVINEIMYHHRPDYEDPSVEGSTYRENPEEWLEIYNHSTEIVDLSGWRLRDGIRFEFPEGTTLAPDSYLVIADDPESFSEKYPNIAHLGGYSGTMGNSDERVELQDANGNPVDAVHYYDEAPWPSYADGGGSSLELINPYMDNARPEAWSPSDESLKSEWHTISYRATAERPVYGPGVRSFHELRLGYIQAGECLIDNVSVVADPDGEQDELVRNRTFGSLFAPITSGNWRLLGTHSLSEAIKDPDAGSVLKIKAESSMNYLNNIVEGALSGEVEIGQEYEVSFDVKWLGGSPQLRSEIYYNKFAKKHILPMPEKHGTPGAINSTFQAAVGPTFAQLRHDPPVPSASEAITVSVQAEDPDGIESITLYYSVDEEDWQTLPMTAQASGFEAIIPDQSSNDIIQFYVEGVDSAGATSVYPPDGPDSGAFVKVDSLADQSRRQAIRMITRASDASAIHVPIDILSNLRRDCTLILNEEDIVYNCGVRLRGSMFSRSGGGDSGVNLKLPADQRFRGMQPTIILRRRNPQEILVKHMANQAVGVPASYNDFVEVRGYRSGQSGLLRMEMARFGENYLKGAFENGDSTPMFKMEGIREFQSSNASGVKQPMPIGWIQSFDFADLGDDKEQYRHVIRMISARKQDDYSRMVAMCQAFSAPDDQLRAAIEEVIDVNEWTRSLAIQMLCGIADVYPIENPHNFNMYVRPTDQKIIAIPWDWDFTFNLGASSKIIDPNNSRKNLWRVLQTPGINRLYRGHLIDLTDKIFNEAYAKEWFEHYSSVAGVSYSSQISYVRSRASSVRSQATADSAAFGIKSNTVDGTQVTLQGTAGVRVKTLRHEETGREYQPTWIDDDTWELTLPLTAGANEITIQALDFSGTKGSLFTPTGIGRIAVTNTSGFDAPTPDNLRITEIMYHPAEPTEEEIAAGFTDQDAFEFIEIMNVGSNPIDLRSVSLSNGTSLDFSTLQTNQLAPREIGLLVSNREAMNKRYAGPLPILGVYEGNLANSGERLTLESTSGGVIQSIPYGDSAPWPEQADGSGASLTLISQIAVDLTDPAAWTASQQPFGTPGTIETFAQASTYAEWRDATFSATELLDESISGFQADPDADGLPNFAEYALARMPMVRDAGSLVSVSPNELSFQQRRGLSQVTISIQSSDELTAWTDIAEGAITRALNGDGFTETVTWPIPRTTGFLRLALKGPE